MGELSGSGHSNTLALKSHRLERQRRHLVCHSMLDWQPVERPEKWSGVGSTSSLADHPGLATVHRESQLVRRRVWRYSSPTWNRQYCTLVSEPSRRLAEYACDAGRVLHALATSLA